MAAALSGLRQLPGVSLLRRCVHTEAKIEALGLTLPNPGKAQANYVLCVRSGDNLFTG
jgi:hypothetical protein